MTRAAIVRGNKIRVSGVDSGSANVGHAIVEGDPAEGIAGLRLLHLEYIQTKKADKKLRKKIRVSTDDRSRLDEIADRLINVWKRFAPDAVAVEWYVPNPKQRSKGGWKAAITVGGVLIAARVMRIAEVEQLPADVKKLVKRYTGIDHPSKEDVIAWLRRDLPGFAEAIDRIAPSNQSHPADAAVHAVVGIFELSERRREAAL